MNAKAQKNLKRHIAVFLCSLAATALLLFACFSITAYARADVSIDLGSGEAGGSLGALEVLFLLVILTLAPSILIMMTSFTRIVIVLSFLRNALGTQQSPPNQIIIGLALFLTLFIMSPTLRDINDNALTPYREGRIEQQEAVELSVHSLKQFMLVQTNDKDLDLFLSLSRSEQAIQSVAGQGREALTQLGLEIIVPAFVTSELKRAFTMGFLIFIPFLIIDMVVASTLMSMGMVMLPPAMISLPFKLMMFVLVDGWGLLLGTLAESFFK